MFTVKIETDAGEYINLHFRYKQLARIAFDLLRAISKYAENLKSITTDVERVHL